MPKIEVPKQTVIMTTRSNERVVLFFGFLGAGSDFFEKMRYSKSV